MISTSREVKEILPAVLPLLELYLWDEMLYYHQLNRRSAGSLIMTRPLILLALLCCAWAASDLEKPREGQSVEEVVDQVVGVVRGLGSLARTLSALSSALEILMFVILKNLLETTIPDQIFNLLQIGIYFILWYKFGNLWFTIKGMKV